MRCVLSTTVRTSAVGLNKDAVALQVDDLLGLGDRESDRVFPTLMGIGPDELAGLHRRFEVVPGAQAQVDWGDEGGILAHVGIAKVYSFHMVLSYSRDPFCCFTTSQDLAAFFEGRTATKSR